MANFDVIINNQNQYGVEVTTNGVTVTTLGTTGASGYATDLTKLPGYSTQKNIILVSIYGVLQWVENATPGEVESEESFIEDESSLSTESFGSEESIGNLDGYDLSIKFIAKQIAPDTGMDPMFAGTYSYAGVWRGHAYYKNINNKYLFWDDGAQIVPDENTGSQSWNLGNSLQIITGDINNYHNPCYAYSSLYNFPSYDTYLTPFNFKYKDFLYAWRVGAQATNDSSSNPQSVCIVSTN